MWCDSHTVSSIRLFPNFYNVLNTVGMILQSNFVRSDEDKKECQQVENAFGCVKVSESYTQ